MMDSRLIEAFRCIEKQPFSLSTGTSTTNYGVAMGKSSEYWGKIGRAVSDFGVDKDEFMISTFVLADRFSEILLEIAEDCGINISDEQLADEFQTRKDRLLSSWLTSAPNTYTATFPINIRSKNLPDTIELFGTKAVKIDYNTWDSNYLSTAKTQDNTNFVSYFDELPNSFNARDWSYFEVDVTARDEVYAQSRVQSLVELRLAEINFYSNLWSAGMPQPAGASRAPNERWSELQIPPFFLLFDGPSYVRYSGIDYDYRRSAGVLHFNDRVNSISDIECNDPNAEKDTLEGYIVAALQAFQDGITERSTRQSFFSFWRGIEMLSNTKNYREMVQRGEFAVMYENDGNSSLRTPLQNAIDELEIKRHELVHEGLRTDIYRYHRNGAKVLLDGLLLLYLDKEGQWDVDEMNAFLKYGVEYSDKFRIVTKILNRISK